VRAVGAFAASRLRTLADRHPTIVDVRGEGVIWGLEVDGDAAAIVEAALGRHLLVNRTAGNVIRLLPPLTITEAELGAALDTLEAAFADVAAGSAS